MSHIKDMQKTKSNRGRPSLGYTVRNLNARVRVDTLKRLKKLQEETGKTQVALVTEAIENLWRKHD